MMHIEEGEKRSFWADSLPAGLSVVRQFDKFVMILWLLALIGYGIVVYYFRSDYDIYYLLTYIAVPFAIVGVAYIFDRKNLASLMILIVMAVAVYLLTNTVTYILLIAYLFVGALGVACVVDAIQRIIFYGVVSRVRYVNVKERLSIGDRLVSFMFNVPPDLDTRNITIEAKTLGGKFPWRDMGGTVMLSLIVGMFFWIYLSMNPMFMSDDKISGDVPMFIFGITLYIPVIVLPFSVFKSLNVKIGTNYRDFKLYNGAIATVQRMAVPIFAALIYVFVEMNEKPSEVIMFIIFSMIIILFTVFLTSIIYYYAMEATTSADISKKWKIFIPVPLLMNLHDEQKEDKKEYPGTPYRDESDMSEIRLVSRKQD